MTPTDFEHVEALDRQAWRDWLAANHAVSPGVWFVFYKKGSGRQTITYDELVEEALCFGWIDSKVIRLDEARYKQFVTPRKPRSIWARSNKERVARLIAEGRMTPAGLAVVEAAQADGSWNVLDDVDALIAPDDLSAALAANPAAAANFAAYPDSAKRAFLYRIQSAKRPETRAKRIAETVAMATENRRLA